MTKGFRGDKGFDLNIIMSGIMIGNLIGSQGEEPMKEEEKIGIKFVATVTGQKGTCHANHRSGQTFELNCYDPGGLCGFFYHDIFPYLSVMQVGGK